MKCYSVLPIFVWKQTPDLKDDNTMTNMMFIVIRVVWKMFVQKKAPAASLKGDSKTLDIVMFYEYLYISIHICI